MKKIVIVCACLAWATGCCRVPRPQTGPNTTEELLASVRAYAQSVPTLRGEVRADHMGPEGRIAGRVYAFAAQGGRLRLEAVSPMDTPIRTVAVDGSGGQFTMSDQEEQRCTEGLAQPCLVGQAIGIEMSAEHIVTTLLGGVPLLESSEVESDWNRCGYFEITIQGEQSGWTEVVRLEPHEGVLVPVYASITGPEGEVVVIEHEDHRTVGSRVMPEQTNIRTPQNEGDLVVIWRSVELDVDLPSRAWTATCPEGFVLETTSCVSQAGLPAMESVEPTETTVEPPEDNPQDTGDPDLGQELGLEEELGL